MNSSVDEKYHDKYHYVSSFYRFATVSPERLAELKQLIYQLGRAEDVRGLVIIASEGINATVSGGEAAVERFRSGIFRYFGFDAVACKDTLSSRPPFRRLKVLIRPQIVTTTELPADFLDHNRGTYLSPQEWDDLLQSPESIVLDTRNSYESRIGSFKGAVIPEIDNFSQFGGAVKAMDIPKDKPLLLYCTGGIRCEKAVPLMKQMGYEQVFQLHGGILGYLEQFPNQSFAGECFVFDNRVSVDQTLMPSQRYRFCTACGDPTERCDSCERCGIVAPFCESCKQRLGSASCSKNCEHHLALKHSCG